MRDNDDTTFFGPAIDRLIKRAALVLLAVLIVGVPGCMFGWPHYVIWSQARAGEAELRHAEYSRQVATQEAHAKMESAKMLAQAEVERARGVAEANRIIGDSLKGNDSYLRYLWIQGLNDGTGEVIYVPTEANLPLLEATRKEK